MVDRQKFAAEDAQGYRIHVVGRNVLVTEAMKNYAIDKISKIERFHQHILDVNVTMDMQRLEHTCTILLHFGHFDIKAHATTSDMYASIDKAVDRLVAKVRKWKGRIHDHQRREASQFEMKVNVLERAPDELAEINADIEEVNRKFDEAVYKPHKVMSTEVIPLKMLTQDEAIMKMELSEAPFMLYRAEEDQKLKVIYRRPDENYAIMQAE